MLPGKWESKFLVNIFLWTQVRKKFLESLENERFTHIVFNLFWKIGWYFVTLGRWNVSKNSQTQKYSIAQICLISYFTFIMGASSQNSLPVRESLSANTKLLLICHSTCPPHTSWRTWRGQASKILFSTCIWFFGRCVQQFCAGHSQKSFPFGRIETMQCLHNIIQ